MNNAAAPSPDLTNPTTAVVRLLATLRWLALLLLIHWLIRVGRKLTAILRQGASHPRFPLFAERFGTDDPAAIRARIAGGLRRATALEDELLATGPADPRLEDLAHCRAIGARIMDIGREIGVFRDAPAPARIIRRNSSRVQRPLFPLTVEPAIATAPAACAQPTATGPPQRTPLPRKARERVPPAPRSQTNAGVPWSFSRRAPAPFSLYALS